MVDTLNTDRELAELHQLVLKLPEEYITAYKNLVASLTKELDLNLSTGDDNCQVIVITAYLDLMAHLQARLEGI